MSYTINLNASPQTLDVYNWSNSANDLFSFSPIPGQLTITVNTVANVVTVNINGVLINAAYHTVQIKQNNVTNTHNCTISSNSGPTYNISVAYSNVVITAPLTPLWPDPLPNGTVGIAYSYTLTASGGVPPYTYTIASGSLPTGLSLNSSTGVVSGTPTQNISLDSVSFTVTDSAP